MEPSLSTADFRKLKELARIYQDNGRLWELLSDYLTNTPDAVTEEDITSFCEGTDYTVKEAALALLCAHLLPNATERDAEFVRRYLAPALQIYTPERYREDAYLRRFGSLEAKEGDVCFETRTYAAYRLCIGGDAVREGHRELVPLCMFDGPFSYLCVSEGGNPWMTLTPIDIDTTKPAIEAARGRVVTFGLGLGYFAFHAISKPQVREVVVVEKNEAVIRLFCRHLLPHIPNREKLRILHADAFTYAEEQMPREHFDMAFVDTWRDAGDGLPMYRKMKALQQRITGTRFLYWVEGFLLSRYRSEVFSKLLWEQMSRSHGIGGELTFSDVEELLTNEGLIRHMLDEAPK